jgi:hypothetical protein
LHSPDALRTAVKRRTALKVGAGLLAAAAQLTVLDRLARLPARTAPNGGPPSDIQHDIGASVAPVFTAFVTATLTRTPTRDDQAAFEEALRTIEGFHPWAPNGLYTFVGYSVDYFDRLGGFTAGTRPNRLIPRLLSDTRRFALERAVASPTDLVRQADGTMVDDPAGRRFDVPLALENNEVLLTLRSDSTSVINDVYGWLRGSGTLSGRRVASPSNRGILSFTGIRLMYQGTGLPRQVADAHDLPFRTAVSPMSPTWTGAGGLAAVASVDAARTTFAGTASARLTTAEAGSYFDNGSIQHLAHAIVDVERFYSEGAGGRDETGAAPFAIRMDGPAMDSMDVPSGRGFGLRNHLAKLQLSAFVPTAEHFRLMRIEQASLALERFVTTTRRQNFLAPPRRHRAFPLVELT